MIRRSLEHRNEQGTVTLVALLMLVVLTLIGVAVTRQTSTDIRIAGNMIPYKQEFYVAEGGVAREVAELNRGSYPLTALDVPQLLASHTDTDLPAPAHEVNGEPYDFTVRYIGYYRPPTGSGFSIIKERPRSTAAKVGSTWLHVEVATITASTSGRAMSSRKSVVK